MLRISRPLVCQEVWCGSAPWSKVRCVWDIFWSAVRILHANKSHMDDVVSCSIVCDSSFCCCSGLLGLTHPHANPYSRWCWELWELFSTRPPWSARGLETCRRPCLVANQDTFLQNWPPSPRNVVDSCELTATTQLSQPVQTLEAAQRVQPSSNCIKENQTLLTRTRRTWGELKAHNHLCQSKQG